MDEEKYIEERVGKRNPFLVPEGYFDHLAESVMAALPERKPRVKPIWLRPVFYAAACICALMISAGVWLAMPDDSQQTVGQIAARQDAGDESLDEAADYMMLDNHDIYTYLADN